VDRACITCDLCQVGQYRSKLYEQCDGVTLEHTQNVCKDEPLGWHDKDGPEFNCLWYAEENLCAKSGSREDVRNEGKVAREACYSRGGGIKTCLSCRTCGQGTYIGSIRCDGTGYSDLRSCETCMTSCPNDSYLNTTHACDGSGFHDRNCRPFNCAQGQYIIDHGCSNRTCADSTGGASYFCGCGNHNQGPACNGNGECFLLAFACHATFRNCEVRIGVALLYLLAFRCFMPTDFTGHARILQHARVFVILLQCLAAHYASTSYIDNKGCPTVSNELEHIYTHTNNHLKHASTHLENTHT